MCQKTWPYLEGGQYSSVTKGVQEGHLTSAPIRRVPQLLPPPQSLPQQHCHSRDSETVLSCCCFREHQNQGGQSMHGGSNSQLQLFRSFQWVRLLPPTTHTLALRLACRPAPSSLALRIQTLPHLLTLLSELSSAHHSSQKLLPRPCPHPAIKTYIHPALPSVLRTHTPTPTPPTLLSEQCAPSPFPHRVCPGH